MTSSTKSNYGLLILIPCVLIAWGFSWPMMKLSLAYMPPLWMGVLRMAIGCVLLFITLIIARRNLLPRKQDWPIIIIIGLLQMGFFTALINLGLERVAAGRSAILVFTTPLWVAPMAVLIFKEKIAKLTLLGLLAGLLGVICLFNPFTFDWSNHHALMGNSFLLLTAFCWAIAIVYVRFAQSDRNPLELAPWQMLIATLFLWIIAPILEPNPTFKWSWHLMALMLYIGPIATAFGFWGVVEMTHRLPPINTTLIMLGVPIIGFISSAIILHEPLAWSTVIALLLLLTGLICVALSKKKKPTAKNLEIQEDEPI